MRITVGMHEAKTNFSRLVRQANDGDDVVVENNGSPVARIVPYVEPARRRKGGFARGMIWIADDFDAPMPELEALIYGDSE
ncbi:MAG: type II toxin-antitoxin system prevent-host-death family antitoxin [Actinobacteria bacterium]|nr:type II toxin-antitoxin system prevent-host-death family antitoxin [Actinomycetota bacterium]